MSWITLIALQRTRFFCFSWTILFCQPLKKCSTTMKIDLTKILHRHHVGGECVFCLRIENLALVYLHWGWTTASWGFLDEDLVLVLSQLTQLYRGQLWKDIPGKRLVFLTKHGGGMCNSSQQTKRRFTTTTTITTPPPPLLLLLLILGREGVVVNLNLLSCCI